MVLYLLKVNDSFTFIGGNPENKSAPNLDYWTMVFVQIKEITGRSFILTSVRKSRVSLLSSVFQMKPLRQTGYKRDEPWDIHLTIRF